LAGLDLLAPRLEPRATASLARSLAAAVSGARNYGPGDGLAVLGRSATLEPRDAALVAADLVRALQATRAVGSILYLAEGLAALAPPPDARGAAPAVEALVRLVPDIPTATSQGPLATHLAALAARLEPVDRARAGTQAAAALRCALEATTDPVALR